MTLLKQIDFEEPGWASLTEGPQDRLAYRQQVLSDLPRGYWPLDETSGIVANDRSGNAQHGQYVPNASGIWSGGAFNQSGAVFRQNQTATQFNGTTGRVQLPNNIAALATETSTLTVEFWIKNGGTGQCPFSASGNNGSPSNLKLFVGTPSATQSLWQHSGPGTSEFAAIYFPFSFPVTTFTHLVLTIDSTRQVKVYVNANLHGSSYHSLTGPPAWTYTAIGLATRYSANLYDRQWAGQIAHVAIYSQCLTVQRVLAHYRTAVGQ